jgi:excisionase family DNA binding protein
MTQPGHGAHTCPSLPFRYQPDSGPGTWTRMETMANHDELDAPEQLLTPSEVAAMFRVNPKTVTRWARAGKLTAIRTLGGHRRFKVSEIRRCLEEMSAER